MNEKCTTHLRQVAGDKPNPEGLLQEIVDQIKELTGVVASSGKKWITAKAEQESIRIKEIQARILQGIAELDIERQRLVQEYDLEQQRLANTHEEKMRELSIEHDREKRQALKDALEIIKILKEMGVDVDLRLVQRNPTDLFDILNLSGDAGNTNNKEDDSRG